MTTVAALRDKVLRKITVLAAEETADAADAVLVEEAIAELHDELEERDLAFWGAVTDMTPAVIPYFVMMMVPRVSEEFEKYNPVQDARAELAERMIRKLKHEVISGEPVEACYF